MRDGVSLGGGSRAGQPEVRFQLRGGEVDHGTQTVDAGTGQGPPNALLDDVEDIVHHAGG